MQTEPSNTVQLMFLDIGVPSMPSHLALKFMGLSPMETVEFSQLPRILIPAAVSRRV
jgi:hypothetical protein